MTFYKYICASLAIMLSCNAAKADNTGNAEDYKRWEMSFGMEGLSFYSNNEGGLGLSKSPLASFRTSLGATSSVGYWWSPNYGTRTKLSGYWGKAIIDNISDHNSIRFYAIQQQAMFNLFNIMRGYDKNRLYELIPYAGIGFMRNCTYDSNSLGIGLGVKNTLRLSDHLKVHLDLSAAFAGKKNDAHPQATGGYKWLSAEIGMTFNLGKIKRNIERQDYPSYYGGSTKYNKIFFANHETDSLGRILAANAIPSGMTLVNRGHIRMGSEDNDSLWGVGAPVKNISVDDFFMDKTEVTNKMYRSFVMDIVDSIAKLRLRDSIYMGSIDKAKESLYITNPVTGEKSLDARQLVYVYSEYDYIGAALKQNQLTSKKTDEVVMITKDTAFIDNSGAIVREKITRPLSSAYDFLNTYAVNICPDTTCWVNDFPKADNSMYMRYYFSHMDYEDFPVVGVTWEQANAFCAWRTEQLKKQMGGSLGDLQPYRLPSEAEWEYAARGKSQNEFPWEQKLAGEGRQLLYANFQAEDGDYTKDGNIITSKVGTYPANSNGLFDMAGNVAEWTSTAYTDAGVAALNNINPQHLYNASDNEREEMKRKTVKGGSWKDPESHIKSTWRSSEYQNQPRSYIGFRCVRSIATKPSERTVLIKKR